MSIKLENDLGFYVCHKTFLNNCLLNNRAIKCKSDLFNICSAYSASKNNKKGKLVTKEGLNGFDQLLKEIEHVKTTYKMFRDEMIKNDIIVQNCDEENNKAALDMADFVYRETEKHSVKINTFGCNIGPAILKEVGTSKFLFPENSRFYCSDISEISRHLDNETFDFILLDPPWWNKYIRRKRKKSSPAYSMMYNDNLKDIPINSLLKNEGMVGVWCTNSQQHFNNLLNDIFPAWNVKYVATWFWLKVSKCGEPICRFSTPPGKQPFEKIIFATKNQSECQMSDKKLLVSIPSAIHSHKPPLVEILNKFLPNDAKCLEIFARYLLPNWTSFGNEVLKLQHESFFEF